MSSPWRTKNPPERIDDEPGFIPIQQLTRISQTQNSEPMQNLLLDGGRTQFVEQNRTSYIKIYDTQRFSASVIFKYKVFEDNELGDRKPTL